MRHWFRSRWWWLSFLLAIVLVGALFFLRQSTTNVMHPALDQLSSVSFSERWSHPQMLKIRELGAKAVPSLRRVLREKNNPTIRFGGTLPVSLAVLGDIGPEAHDAVGVLEKLLSDPNPSVVKSASEALARIRR